MQDQLHNPQEPSCPDAPKVEAVSSDFLDSSPASNSDFAAKFDAARNRKLQGNAGVQSASPVDSCTNAAEKFSSGSEQNGARNNGNADEISAILNEVKQMRDQTSAANDDFSTSAEEKPNLSDTPKKKAAQPTKKKKKSSKSSGSSKKKPKKKQNAFVTAFRNIFPVSGDKPLEIVRKLVFLTAIIVFAACLYLIVSYYYDLYTAGKAYDKIKEEFDSFVGVKIPLEDVSDEGEILEYLDYNDVANAFLSSNPDLVGFINIEGTKVSYPVVQKKSTDPNVNTNDYYLYRAFDQSANSSTSKSGCIFMDYRCHFDEVVNHRRSVENSDNFLIYGHNMMNETMFGCLRNYQRNINKEPGKWSYYSEHPIVTLYSLYKTYQFKIFAVFLVDGEDFTSKYAFDCWNTFDFEDEDAFYTFVNSAKRRNIVHNDVDVTYGDKLLSLYTCSSMIPNSGKLIVMCREVRPGEDPLEGTQNAYLNDNILWPEAYYRIKKIDCDFDESRFVPFGID